MWLKDAPGNKVLPPCDCARCDPRCGNAVDEPDDEGLCVECEMGEHRPERDE